MVQNNLKMFAGSKLIFITGIYIKERKIWLYKSDVFAFHFEKKKNI